MHNIVLFSTAIRGKNIVTNFYIVESRRTRVIPLSYHYYIVPDVPFINGAYVGEDVNLM